MDILSIHDLTFTENLNGKQLLKQISFSLKEGSITCLCGETGSGKTTLLRLLKKELSPFGKMTGNIYFEGKNREEYREEELAFLIGYVGQNPEHECVTDRVWRELAFGLENMGISQKEMRRRIAEISAYFGIDDWYTQKTSALSGGQKQLLCLASVLAMQPKLLLLDEPTAQLDPIAANAFMNTLVRCNRELGITILIVEHRLEEILPIADHVLILEEGILVNDSTVQDIHPTEAIQKALPCGMQLSMELKNQGKGCPDVAPVTVPEARDYVRKLRENGTLKDYITDDLAGEVPKERKEPVLVLKDLWASYEKKGKEIVRGLHLTLYSGEIYCLVGGNGSGKTTAIKAISGQMPYTNQRPLKSKASIGVLPQDVETVFLADSVREDFELCGIQTIEEAGELSFVYNGEKKKSEFDISALLSMHPYDLSGGEKQKVALEKLLLLGTQVLLLDEPAKGLDAKSREELMQRLVELKKRGKSILIVTHDTEFAAMIADRIGLFFQGEIFAEEAREDFFRNNSFYTTQAARITKDLLEGVYRTDQLLSMVKGVKKV